MVLATTFPKYLLCFGENIIKIGTYMVFNKLQHLVTTLFHIELTQKYNVHLQSIYFII